MPADYEACSPVHVMLSDSDSKQSIPRRTIAATLLAFTLLVLGLAVVLNGRDKLVLSQRGEESVASKAKDMIQSSLKDLMQDELKIDQRPSRLSNIRGSHRSPPFLSVQSSSKLAQLHREAQAIVSKSKLMDSRGKAVLEQLEDIPDDMLEVGLVMGFSGACSDLSLQIIDFTVDPCDDFYKFSCGNFDRTAQIPTFKSQWTRSFDQVCQLGLAAPPGPEILKDFLVFLV